jgi:thioredoxin 1
MPGPTLHPSAGKNIKSKWEIEMAGNNVMTFTDAAFDSDVLKSPEPVLVDFWAEWCGPCRMMAPTIDTIASEYAGKAKVGKLNVDDNGQTAMRYNIRGIPTLLLFKGGKVVDQRVGAVGKDEVQKMLNAHV